MQALQFCVQWLKTAALDVIVFEIITQIDSWLKVESSTLKFITVELLVESVNSLLIWTGHKLTHSPHLPLLTPVLLPIFHHCTSQM